MDKTSSFCKKKIFKTKTGFINTFELDIKIHLSWYRESDVLFSFNKSATQEIL